MKLNVTLRFCLLSTLVAIVGCGGGSDAPPMAPVSGTLTLNGAPLPDAMVTFVPDKGPVAIGSTDGEGKFSLKTGRNDGAVIGNHRVSIILDQGGGDEVAPAGDLSDPDQLANFYEQSIEKQEEGETKSPLPEKYSRVDSSGLAFKVEDGENDFAIEL